MTEQDPPEQVDVETFFEGVPAMRAYLERHIHDPVRRRERLRRIAQGLLRSRSARGLVAWLGDELLSALGAQTCGVWINTTAGWRMWHRLGAADTGPTPAQLAALEGPALDGCADDGLLVPVPGLEGISGAVWLAGGTALDDDSRSLLQAIAGTAGMALEQALRVEALARDPTTGLLSSASFIEQAGAELRQKRSSLILFILGLRLPGDGQLALLGEAARSLLGPGTPLTVRSAAPHGEPVSDFFAVPALEASLTGEREVQALAAAIGDQIGEPRWSAAFVATGEPIDDLAGIMVKLSAALDETEAGDVRRLRLG